MIIYQILHGSKSEGNVVISNLREEARPPDLAGANPTWLTSGRRHNEWQKISTKIGLMLSLYQPAVGFEGYIVEGKSVLLVPKKASKRFEVFVTL